MAGWQKSFLGIVSAVVLLGCSDTRGRTEVLYTDLGYEGGVFTYGETPFTGTAVEFSKGGQKIKAYEFKDGSFDGLVIEWYGDGTKKTETRFRAGQRHGNNIYWNPDGSLQKEQLWEGGELSSEINHEEG